MRILGKKKVNVTETNNRRRGSYDLSEGERIPIGRYKPELGIER